MSFHTKEFKPQ